MDTISEKDTQSADDKKKEKISYIEAIPEWQALRRERTFPSIWISEF